MKTKTLTAAQIDTLAQCLSETPIEPATSAKKAGDSFARWLAARIGAERAARAFTSILTAATVDQAEARLTLVLDYGNPDPAGEAIPVPVDEPKAVIPPAGRQAAGHSGSSADRRTAVGAGFLQADPCPLPRQAGPDRRLGRGRRQRRVAGLRDQPGLFQPQGHGPLPQPLRDRHTRPRAGEGGRVARGVCRRTARD